VLTLFDSGGNDTLDLSGWSDPSRIDLVPGAYSSGNEMTNNVAIAYSTTIENAIGGSGNDVIAGNDAANRLVGGAGDDQLARRRR
jgi:serralysin